MQGNFVEHVFPPWDLMIAMDVAIPTMAIVVTALFAGFYAKVKRGRMMYGVLLLLVTFWSLAITYFVDLYAMLVLPTQIGMAPAMDVMIHVHTEASWYLNTFAVFSGIAGVYFVVTAFLHQLAKLQAAVAEAEKQNKQKSTFFASMSHELRTPLNAIIGFAGLIKDKQIDEDPKLYHEYGKIIVNSGTMMLGLVDELLDLARIEAGKLKLNFEKVDIRDLVEETTLTMTQLAVEAGVSLNVQVSDELPEIDADRRSLEQITLNLVSNSIKFTPECGTVTVTIEWRDKGLDTESAVLIVADTGIGMPPSLIESVFDPYVQGDPSGTGRARGTGLGLAVCKRLVDAHDGTIEIKSTVGEGTTVTVALPTLLASQKRSEQGRPLKRCNVTSSNPGRPADELAA